MRGMTHVLCGSLVLLLNGCRVASRVAEVPRVDLELGGGNRGYLVGRPPEGQVLKATRQMVETDVEVPSFYRPKRSGGPASLDIEAAPPERDLDEEAQGAPSRYDTYVVQKGDSLWSIAAKPEIYGKASRWRRLFDANRTLLKDPDALRAGMTINIPRGAPGSEDEGTAFQK